MCGCFVVWVMMVRCGWYVARVLGCFVVMMVGRGAMVLGCGAVVPTLN